MRLGLRAKSALALCFSIFLVLALATLTAWQALRSVQENLGSAYARNVTRYNKQHILAPVLRELALSQRLADSELTRSWLLDENNPQKKALFFAEAERYRSAFEDRSYFAISRSTRAYYFNDTKTPHSTRPRYYLKSGEPTDAWFFSTMKNTKEFNLNVDRNPKLRVTKVWFNVMVKHQGRNIGLTGTGLDLTAFLERFITDREIGITPMIVNRQGAIQAHPNRELIDYASVNEKGDNRSTIYRLLSDGKDHAAVKQALQKAERDPDSIQMLWAELDGRRELFAFSFIPELNWAIVTAMDLQSAQVLDERLLMPATLLGAALMVLLVIAILIAVDRILLRPLLKLTDSARAVAAGDYAIALPPAGQDELGELTQAFGRMASQVQTHTAELETKVQQRTRELSKINEQMGAANKKISDSIEYAGLIQNTILPNQDMARVLDENYFVLWQPRDIVGGDFYLFRDSPRGCLIGVVDCAGHGVPGALMTMVAHSAFCTAMDTLDLADPAQLLTQVHHRIRSMLRTAPTHSYVATNMDAGLAFYDYEAQSVTFSGAKISLYWSDGNNDGNNIGEIKGARHALGGQHSLAFVNETIASVSDSTFYLTTDGFLDQAGGLKGYSFGNARFAELLVKQPRHSFSKQQQALAETLAAYQGALPQRDDITVLGFNFKAVRTESQRNSRGS